MKSGPIYFTTNDFNFTQRTYLGFNKGFLVQQSLPLDFSTFAWLKVFPCDGNQRNNPIRSGRNRLSMISVMYPHGTEPIKT